MATTTVATEAFGASKTRFPCAYLLAIFKSPAVVIAAAIWTTTSCDTLLTPSSYVSDRARSFLTVIIKHCARRAGVFGLSALCYGAGIRHLCIFFS